MKDVERFFDRRPDLEYKVVLFTNKKKTWNIFKGITAEFNNRLDFAEIYKSARPVLHFFEIRKVPKIVVYKRIRSPAFSLEDFEVHEYDDDKEFEYIKEFLKDFALEEPSLPELEAAEFEPEDVIEEEPMVH